VLGDVSGTMGFSHAHQFYIQGAKKRKDAAVFTQFKARQPTQTMLTWFLPGRPGRPLTLQCELGGAVRASNKNPWNRPDSPNAVATTDPWQGSCQVDIETTARQAKPALGPFRIRIFAIFHVQSSVKNCNIDQKPT